MAETVTKPKDAAKPQGNGPKQPDVKPIVNDGFGELGPGKSPLEKARAARAPADPNETKAQKFKRLANRRVPKALLALRNIGSLFNRSQYEWTGEQAVKVTAAIAEELGAIRRRIDNIQSVESTWSL